MSTKKKELTEKDVSVGQEYLVSGVAYRVLSVHQGQVYAIRARVKKPTPADYRYVPYAELGKGSK